jgi:hypothetical protein
VVLLSSCCALMVVMSKSCFLSQTSVCTGYQVVALSLHWEAESGQSWRYHFDHMEQANLFAARNDPMIGMCLFVGVFSVLVCVGVICDGDKGAAAQAGAFGGRLQFFRDIPHLV